MGPTKTQPIWVPSAVRYALAHKAICGATEKTSATTARLPDVNSFPRNSVAMAQQHKGSRVYMAARLPADVYAAVKTKAEDTGLSVSQLVADLLSESLGRPDLVRELNRERGELPLAM